MLVQKSNGLGNLNPRSCIVDIVVNRLGSLHATIPVEMAGRADGKKSQLMMHSIGFISAKAVTLLLVGSSRLEEFHGEKERQQEWNRFLCKELKFN